MSRPVGCLVWILALVALLLVLSLLFGGFQRGTKVGADDLVRPQATSSIK